MSIVYYNGNTWMIETADHKSTPLIPMLEQLLNEGQRTKYRVLEDENIGSVFYVASIRKITSTNRLTTEFTINIVLHEGSSTRSIVISDINNPRLAGMLLGRMVESITNGKQAVISLDHLPDYLKQHRRNVL